MIKFVFGLDGVIRDLDSNSPTEYMDIILKHYPSPEIWADIEMSDVWKMNAWLDCYVGNEYKMLKLDVKEKRRMLDSNKDIFLVDASADFENYNRVVLIDREYNKEANAPIRIYEPRALDRFLKKYKGVG